MKTILASTYAVNPTKGSEDGMGWNYVLQIARFNKVIAVTRENNKSAIEEFMKSDPKPEYNNIRFLYFDLPYWMRFWKKGSRGAMLYYWMWQRGIVSFVKRQGVHFDIVHNLNFHNDWTPSYLWKLKKPFVWGPIGHHPLIPGQYLKAYSIKYWIKDRLTWLIKKYFWNISCSLRRTAGKADYVWAMNSGVTKMLHIKTRKINTSASVASQDYSWNPSRTNDEFKIITAGRLVPLKGFDLTIKAVAGLIKDLKPEQKEKVSLTVVGSGPEEAYYKALAQKSGIQSYVTFINWIERDKLLELMKASSVFLFPSHEGAGMVVPEALSFGLPVVCLDNQGPGEFIDETCGFAIPIQDYENTILSLSSALKKLFLNNDVLKSMQHKARLRFIELFHWDRRGEKLSKIYNNL